MVRSPSHYLRAVVALAVIFTTASLAHALPAALGYGAKKIALKAPNEEERELLALINVDRAVEGQTALQWDGTMSAVAREHSQDMADHDHFEYASSRLGPMEYRLHRAGVPGPDCRYAIFLTGTLSHLVEQMRSEEAPYHLKPATNMGVGVVAKGQFPRQLYVTLVSREDRFTLETAFPTQAVYGKRYRVAGQLARGLRNPKLIVTVPDGGVHETELDVSDAGKIETSISFVRGRGKYSVEILAVGDLGPTVACLMHCYVGTGGYPRPPKAGEGVSKSADLSKVAMQMFQMVNASRRSIGLRALEYDERLAAVAVGHSQDMADNAYFAHVSPTMGTLGERMERAGIKAQSFTENIAANRDLAAAHKGLMDSPGHRRNILDKDATHIGIGIVRGEGDNLVITQNYSQAFPEYDTKTMAAEFLKEVNQQRARADLRKLSNDTALSKIALENSLSMIELDSLGYDKAREQLRKRNLRYDYIGMNVFKSNFPPTSEQIQNTLDERYHGIGIGIAKTETEDGETTLWITVLLGER